MDDFNPETDEDNGYKKPAGPVWAYIGGFIGFVTIATIFWYFESHH
jgi:hypothetical protein